MVKLNFFYLLVNMYFFICWSKMQFFICQWKIVLVKTSSVKVHSVKLVNCLFVLVWNQSQNKFYKCKARHLENLTILNIFYQNHIFNVTYFVSRKLFMVRQKLLEGTGFEPTTLQPPVWCHDHQASATLFFASTNDESHKK